MVKFAHLADVHIGCWRDPHMRELSMIAFEKAIEEIIGLDVDFILISGDLFNTALPGVDFLKRSITVLKLVKQAGIRVYVIAGSHDFSPSGKTMLDVIEETGLIQNVFRGSVKEGALHLRFTTDSETGTLMTGILGKKGMLEREYYEALGNRDELETAEGFKIFLFHTALEELKPKHLEHMPAYGVSFLPQGFNYYAGGHVHIVEHKNLPGYDNVIYPGPLFPANFSELEKLGNGSYFLYDNGTITKRDVKVKNVMSVVINAHGKTPAQVEAEVMQAFPDVKDNILLLRVEGLLAEGNTSNIDFRQAFSSWYEKGAFFVMKNTTKLESPEYEEVKVSAGTTEDVEERLIKEHVGQVKISTEDEAKLIKDLITVLSEEQHEGEKKYEYTGRVLKDAQERLGA